MNALHLKSLQQALANNCLQGAKSSLVTCLEMLNYLLRRPVAIMRGSIVTIMREI